MHNILGAIRRIRIRINPEIWIRIRDHFRLMLDQGVARIFVWGSSRHPLSPCHTAPPTTRWSQSVVRDLPEKMEKCRTVNIGGMPPPDPPLATLLS